MNDDSVTKTNNLQSQPHNNATDAVMKESKTKIKKDSNNACNIIQQMTKTPHFIDTSQ